MSSTTDDMTSTNHHEECDQQVHCPHDHAHEVFASHIEEAPPSYDDVIKEKLARHQQTSSSSSAAVAVAAASAQPVPSSAYSRDVIQTIEVVSNDHSDDVIVGTDDNIRFIQSRGGGSSRNMRSAYFPHYTE